LRTVHPLTIQTGCIPDIVPQWVGIFCKPVVLTGLETKMPDLVPTLKRGLINTLRLRRESLREANSGLLRIADFEVRGIPPMRDEAAHGWGTHGSVLPRESEVEFAVSHSCAKDAHEWGTLCVWIRI
jgi:hypothetical protein